jgi:streptogramin lyase
MRLGTAWIVGFAACSPEDPDPEPTTTGPLMQTIEWRLGDVTHSATGTAELSEANGTYIAVVSANDGGATFLANVSSPDPVTAGDYPCAIGGTAGADSVFVVIGEDGARWATDGEGSTCAVHLDEDVEELGVIRGNTSGAIASEGELADFEGAFNVAMFE